MKTQKVTQVLILMLFHSGLFSQTPPPPPPPPAPLTEVPVLVPGNNIVIVSGTATLKLVPDFVSFSVGVETTGPTIADTVKSNNVKVQKVLTALKAMSVKPSELQTSIFRLNPLKDKGTRVGYRVTNRISVGRNDVSNIGELIEAAISAGANEIDGPNFSVANEKAHQDKGLELAFADAKAKASQLARLAGRKLGPVQGMTDGSSSPFVIKSYYGISGGVIGGVDSIGIETGTYSIESGVTVAFKLD